MTANEDRPRIVTIGFVLWALAAVLLIAAGLALALSVAAMGFYRGAGVLSVLAGIGLGFLAGRARLGDARFHRAAVALSLVLVVLLAVFSVLSHGLVWRLIMILVIVAAALMVRPSARDWFTAVHERTPDA